jgi:tRNA (guanine26-N2/guanine27-N2)-dimethyltransferase
MDGWPGHLWLEGATPVHLTPEQARPERRPRGPARRTGPRFLNPAMAPARTRSVLLLSDALNHGWLVPDGAPIRCLDAMCSTGLRVRRWRHEVPAEQVHRLHITANDLDEEALAWAKSSLEAHPTGRPLPERGQERSLPEGGFEVEGLRFTQEDARMALLHGGWQWIDLDPFGSPVPFLDAALQGMARRGVLEVTATDTAALTGSSASSARRRYGFQGPVDAYAHDDAVRALLGTIAMAAARVDRCITPLLALFDGHHVRVSVLVRTSKNGASEVLDHIGWRVREDDVPYRLVRHPDEEEVRRASGPLWTGPLWDEAIASRLTEEHERALCSPTSTALEALRADGLTWDHDDLEHAAREGSRTVRHIAAAAALMARNAKDVWLLRLDDLPRWAGTGGAPKMSRLLAALEQGGHQAARAPDLNPFIVTDAPFEEVLAAVRLLT